MRRAGLLFVAIGLLIGADEPKKGDVKEEQKKFEGTWRFASLKIEGQDFPEAAFKNARLVLKDHKHTYTNGGPPARGVYVVDPASKPKTIDVSFSDGPEKGKTLHGIYELEGDTYKLCIALGGKPRPTEFASKAGSGHVLEVLKREKP